jgi:hypothetical protein
MHSNLFPKFAFVTLHIQNNNKRHISIASKLGLFAIFQADKTSCDMDEKINEKLTDKTLKKDEIFDFIMNPNRDDSDLYLR